MPAVEIADSIVQSGRETLEKVRDFNYIYFELHTNGLQAIDVIDGNRKWGAKVYKIYPVITTFNLTVTKKVVYGDTDSVFV